MIRYAITEGETDGSAAVRRWKQLGVNFVQLRAKQLDSGELAAKARRLQADLRETNIPLLINGRVDVALAAGAAGVHLTSHPDELVPAQVRALMPGAVVSVSCHALAEVERAKDAGADWILFGPVFEKRVAGKEVAHGLGLDVLQKAAGLAPERVLALGGVTADNLQACIRGGAAGAAAIRMYAAPRPETL